MSVATSHPGGRVSSGSGFSGWGHGGPKSSVSLQCEVMLLIVAAGIAAAFDDQKAELAGVGPAVQIVLRHGVRVVPARACRIGCEPIAAGAVRGNRGSTFFFGTI